MRLRVGAQGSGMLSGVGVPELWECSVELWPRDFGVSVWGFRGVPWGQCLELWEFLGLAPAFLGMLEGIGAQGLGMFDGVGAPCFRDGLWGQCPGFWECLAPWTLGMPNRFSAWGFKDEPWGQCPGI